MKDKIMNYLRTGKHRIIAAVLITLVMVTCTAVVNANPTVDYRTSHGFMFTLPNGEQRFCGLNTPEEVRCMDQAENVYSCEYRDPPEYFANCKRIK